MAITTNKVDCLQGVSGTWYDGCNVILKEITKIFLIHPSVKLDLLLDTFDNAKTLSLQKQGLLIPLNNVKEVKSTDSKNNFQVFANKSKVLASRGLIEMMGEFEATECFVKSMFNLTKRKWNVAFLDSEGKLFMDYKNGKLQGFDTSSVEVDTQSIPDGGSKTSMITLEMQLSVDGTAGFNERKRFVNSTDDFDIYSLKGVQDVKIETLTKTVANFTVKVVSGCDQTTPVTALSTANFRLVDATTGLAVVVVAAHQGLGVYKLTGAGVTAGAKTLQLYDSVLNLPVADVLATDLFASNIEAVVLL